jgi:chromosomal replication initiator protein
MHCLLMTFNSWRIVSGPRRRSFIHAQRRQIVITSDKVPRDIAGLEERLRSRFESGLIAEITPPDLETRMAIIQKKAAHEDLQLSLDVAAYIAENVRSNVRELEGCLARLSALSSMSRASVTIEFARRALHDLIRVQDQRPGIEVIQQTVADLLRIPLPDLKSKKRTQRVAFCRQVAMYLCRKLTDNSFPIIGEYFGRDHSTVIHANNLIARRTSNDPAFRMWVDKIERELKVSVSSAAKPTVQSADTSHAHP